MPHPKLNIAGLLLAFCIIFLGTIYSANAQHSKYKPTLSGGIPVLIDTTIVSGKDTTTASSRHIVKRSSQRLQNLCGVTASFTPGFDSIFSTSTNIVFTSTSINAVTFQWQVNGMNYTTGPVLNFWFSTAGSYEITLVAGNGNCTDTYSVTIVLTGIPPDNNNFFSEVIGINNHIERPGALANMVDSGFLVGGTTTLGGGQAFIPSSLLVKMRTGKCIQWSKRITHQVDYAHATHQVYGLKDTGFLVSGALGQSNYLMRVDKTGSPVWAKQYSSVSGIYAGYKQLYEMSDGSIIGATSPFSNVLHISKLDANGEPVWTKYMQKQELFISDFITTAAIFEWKTALYILGTLKIPDVFPNTSPFVTFLLKLNPATGEVIWTRQFMSNDGAKSIFSKDIQVHGDNLLISSLHYNTLGGYGVFPMLHWIDSSGSVLAVKSITQNLQLEFPTGVKAGVLPGGNIMLYYRGRENTGFQPGFFLHAYYMKLGTDTSILVNRQTGGGTSLNSTYDSYSVMNFNGKAISNLGTHIAPLVPWLSHSENIWFHYRDSSMTDNGCSYPNTAFSINNMPIQATDVSWLKDSSLTIISSPVTLQLNDVYPQIKSSCPDYIDSCAILKIRGQIEICNLNDVYTYKAGRNSQCPQAVEWSFAGAITMVSQTDSSISVRFNSFGNHKIIARLRNSCNPVLDSINITAGSFTRPLNLGEDLVICEGNSRTLHASPYYLLYRWQDGSTDSLLTINTAGIYWVEVTDSCGNLLRDTVNVTLAPPVPLYAGPDRAKCNQDTLHLRGPAGFLNYTWSNNYNIVSSDGQSVIVNPLVDTAYYLRAELTPGCFGFDTVKVTVHHSPPVHVGNDTSFCRGDSVRFDAGPLFVQYAWSNNASSAFIIVKDPGTYSVVATTVQGCKSYDTSKVINVWALPTINITGKPVICTGTPTVLNAGSVTGTYLWSDGSSSQTISVTNPGSYHVVVTDDKGCVGKDTFVVTHISRLPANFLPPDTAICSYETIQLKPLQSFTSYLWSTNATSSSIAVSVPGQYWVQVRDVNACEGADSIVVRPKECITAVYFPTAFTPNNDGKNDVLKPVIFGGLKQYRYTVYNRWGQIVFQTSDPLRGWDGRRSGSQQDSNLFVWTCTYQLEGETVQVKKGTVMLIR